MADVPVECSLDDIRSGQMDRKELARLFRDLEFRRLAEEFSAVDEPAPAPNCSTALTAASFSAG